jgi:hypothetical protein
MKKWEAEAAIAVVGLGAVELWKLWNTNAPTLAEVRQAPAGDITVRQKLMDADVTVGSMALIIGTALAVLMHDTTALVLMLVIFAALSFLHHWIMAAEPR